MLTFLMLEKKVKIFRLRADLEIQSPVYHNGSTATTSKVIVGVLQRVGLDRILTLYDNLTMTSADTASREGWAGPGNGSISTKTRPIVEHAHNVFSPFL